MLFSLSFKNIKKSLKDYSIYFFTLVVAVSIFYTFNSLDSQTVMLKMNESRYQIVQSLIMILGYVSIFISIILGFLIVYSNNFLIKRRKKEFGLYLTLGMSKTKVSTILVMETLLVGIISLITGLLVGVLLSQFLSVFTAKMFEINMEHFTFVFSSSAFVKTIIYFGIIFMFVMFLNIISISRYKLIDLLNANKKNEKIKFRNKYVILIAFILSVLLLWYAYKRLFEGALVTMDNKMLYMILAGAIGTFLFFFSVAGFFLKIFERIKTIYYKNLNMFILKQVNNKINTTVVSTTVISLMLLLTIGILSGSMSLSSVYNKDIVNNNKTDFTITQTTSNCVVQEDLKCKFEKIETDLYKLPEDNYFKDSVKEYVYYDIFQSEDLNMSNLISEKKKEEIIKKYGEGINIEDEIPIMSASNYNEILKLYGEKQIDLKENEYLLTANLDTARDFFKDQYESGGEIILNNIKLKPASKEIVSIGFTNFTTANNYGTVIVSDSIIDNFELSNSNIIGNYSKHKDIERFDSEFQKEIISHGPSYSINTKEKMKNSSIGISAILTFVGLYLGIIFSISSATVLAIGQLSESSDNKDRFRVLRQLGADEIMIKKALFTQIGITFLAPLVVAVIHSFFGLKELTKLIQIFGSIDITKNIIITTLFIVVVYGGYFLSTYICSKNIIKED